MALDISLGLLVVLLLAAQTAGSYGLTRGLFNFQIQHQLELQHIFIHRQELLEQLLLVAQAQPITLLLTIV